MKKIIKSFTALMAALSAAVFSLCGAVSYLTPSELTVNHESSLKSSYNFPVSIRYDGSQAIKTDTASGNNNSVNGQLMLFDAVPVKNVSINFAERQYVTPCGTPFGIKIYSDGLVVARTTEVETENGTKNPSADANIVCGDIITAVNGEKLRTNEQLLSCVENSRGKSIKISGKRNGKNFSADITPVIDKNQNSYRIGLWVKDSCAGIGTLTFVDNQSGTFAGLGHGICDSESGQIMPLQSGDIVKANISSVRKGCCGSPGALCGYFTDGESVGTLKANSEYGVYGTLNSYKSENTEIPVAFRQEVIRGKAQILTTVDGNPPQYYDAEIENISYNNCNATKNMVIKITDEKLIEKTGGIVQGMSGSPIIQNGMLVGAVTHVFVNDPSHGYAIFAENMIAYNNSIVQNSVNFVS